MYIQIRNDKIVSWSKQPFNDSFWVDIDYDTFRVDMYKVENGEIFSIEHTPEFQAKILEEKKQEKMLENNTKKNVEFIETTFGKLKTETPIGDLKIIAPNLMFMAELSDGLPAGFLRFYDNDNKVFLSSKMNKEQAIALYQEILMAYSKIDYNFTQYAQKISEAKTNQELEEIEILY